MILVVKPFLKMVFLRINHLLMTFFYHKTQDYHQTAYNRFPNTKIYCYFQINT